MQSIFLDLVKLSLIGSLFAAAVMLVRLVFRKAPKWLFCILWGVVALRLICPVSIESNVSLVPDRLATGQIITNVGNEYIGDVNIIYESNVGYSNAIEAGRQPIYSGDGYYVVTEKDSLEAPKTVGETVYPILSWVWVAGMVLMLAYTAVSYLLLRKKMEEATHLQDHIWQCEQVDSPFVLGFIKPRIYLPYAITDSDMANVIAHEQAHIQRKDHWWKPIGFLLLSIHWFNPVLWLAYILLCRDIEAACDEKVIKHMEKDEMRAYSTALLHCSAHRRRIAACPLAFGEVGVKERIKRVMNYKKPAFWIIITAVAACTVAVVCFFTNPSNSSGSLPNIHSHAYVVEEVTYEDGMYSFSVIAGENSPVYRVAEDMTLASQMEVSDAGQWAELGKLEDTTLTKENFDDLFKDSGFWTAKVNAKDIRRNTVKAWRLVYKQEILYYVLQQKNGDLYLAYGYQAPDPNADPGSFYEHIRWLFKLTMDTTGMSGMVAKSGDNAVPMLSFPKGTMIKDYVESIYWLTIDPSDEEFAPFTVWKDGEEIRGIYTAYDAVTFESLTHFIPSGLDPQTYLFQNADPTRGYIVLATFSTEPDAEIYAFGAKFHQDSTTTPTEAITVEQEQPLTIVSNGEKITPFLHFAYSGSWNGTGFLCADGEDVGAVLPQLETDGQIPRAEYSGDFDVVLGDNATISHILLFDENFNPLDTAWNIADLSNLATGNYYVGIVVNEEGDYIEKANEKEYTGWVGVVRLSVARAMVWDWAQEIKQADITYATPWSESKTFEALNEAETRDLVMLLNKLTKDSFTENKELTGGTPSFGVEIVIGSECYYVNEYNGPNGRLELVRYNGKQWIIDNADLFAFIQEIAGNVISE